MTRWTGGLHQHATLLDGLHLAAILACSVWTAKVIVEERFGDVGTATAHILDGAQLVHDGSTVTIKLDDNARTAAR